MKPLLFLHGITLAFGGLSVIDNLDIQVRKGSRCGLIGPNGAGKTTIFNLLSGVYRVTAGEIRLDDQPIDDVPLDQRIDLGHRPDIPEPALDEAPDGAGKHHARSASFGQSMESIFAPLGSRWNRCWRDEATERKTARNRHSSFLLRIASKLSLRSARQQTSGRSTSTARDGLATP